jgi:hypothetical protein
LRAAIIPELKLRKEAPVSSTALAMSPAVQVAAWPAAGHNNTAIANDANIRRMTNPAVSATSPDYL